ncbi:Peroxidase 18 [Raphanus sativus]|uniref:Peroxidase n=1 Tax=Raphanus sativus TaxID=3726 RepID=A0A6J0JNW7_RAPSA|nr:peroxidase 18 [Raphanus sativus]KAJ4890666.1 Peroxidase 18 [Raphanus sativus]
MAFPFSSCKQEYAFLSSLLLVLPLLLLISSSVADLSFNFYSSSCPGAEFIVRNTVRSASSSDPSVLGKLVRLIFHDCFVQGCDASVLVRGNGTERSDPGNASLGGFDVIESAKNVLEIFCPGIVSCADILVLAARDAVEALGGPVVAIPTGRRDGTVSAAENVRPNIIDTDFTVDKMINIFSSKGLSVQDLVVLSGAHTVGAAHCNTFNSRFKRDPRGNFELIDASLDNSYAQTLLNKCSSSMDPTTAVVNNDPETSSTFDNQYYKNLLAHKGLFQTDSALMEDDRTRKIVEILANDEESFLERWTESFMKMSVIGVRVGEEGEIRRSCSSVN